MVGVGNRTISLLLLFWPSVIAFVARRPHAHGNVASSFQHRNYLQASPQSSFENGAGKSINAKALKVLENCTSATQARRLLEKELLNDRNPGSLYKSIKIPPGASSRGISDGDLAIQTRLVNKKYSIMELIEVSGNRDADRASLGLLSVMIGSTLTALLANQKLPGPEIIRFLVVWIFSFAPLFFVGYGISDAEKLQGILLTIQRNVFPAYRKRMLQHEAGHFLMGHLLGWPIAGYRANAIKNAVEFYPLSDADKAKDYAGQLGFDAVRAARRSVEPSENQVAPFFSDEGRGREFVEQRSVFRNAKNYTSNPFLKLSSRDDPSKSWPYRGFDEITLDQLTVISVAGVCAEILAFGNAEGGVADLNQLRQVFNAAGFEMTEREIENRIKYALGYTMSQLRLHLGALDALADAMERESSIVDCVLAIETCQNPSGQSGILGDYELKRRLMFRNEKASWIEKFLLGDAPNADVEENRMVEGKGGGYLKQTFRLTGDDPFYLALAAAFLFFVWASSGGLTLH